MPASGQLHGPTSWRGSTDGHQVRRSSYLKVGGTSVQSILVVCAESLLIPEVNMKVFHPPSGFRKFNLCGEKVKEGSAPI